MAVGPVLQWITFGVFALVAVASALGMTTTMSMFRSGVFLMGSFFGVAGLFVLLLADLLAWLQVMMYLGGMLVMILFMVLFSHDPGGATMASTMPLHGPERFFNLGLARRPGAGGGEEAGHAGGRGGQPAAGRAGHGGHEGHGAMPMAGMSMFTPIKRPAAVMAGLVGLLLVALLLWRPAWPVAEALPDQDSPRRVGHLLMGKYMIAFEGAGLLILMGIFGAVMVSRPGRRPGRAGRDALRAAADEPPAPIDADRP